MKRHAHDDTQQLDSTHARDNMHTETPSFLFISQWKAAQNIKAQQTHGREIDNLSITYHRIWTWTTDFCMDEMWTLFLSCFQRIVSKGQRATFVHVQCKPIHPSLDLPPP